MGNYTKSDIKFIIRENDFERLFRNCDRRMDKAWLVVLWLTGARPAELFELRKENIIIDENSVTFIIVTKKLGFKHGGFVIDKRRLNLKVPIEHRYIKLLIAHLKPLSSENLVFPFCPKTGENIVSRVGRKALNKELCPYNFRHSRMTLLAEKGATMDELKRFKGARSDSGVREYIHAREVNYEVEFEI